MKPMDRNGLIGITGTLASWGLAEIQVVFAIVASLLTSIWMGISIYSWFKKR